jgi:hypothetical protein
LKRITDAFGDKDVAKVTPNDCQKLIDAAITQCHPRIAPTF